MLAPPLLQIALEARALHRIVAGAGVKILCLEGAIWVTQENDARDTVLTAGQSFVLDRPGLAVLYALSRASALLLPSRARAEAAVSDRAQAGP